MTGSMVRDNERWTVSWLALVLVVAGTFRLTELDGLPPFIDETAALALSTDYRSWDVWSRLLHGKLLGYLWLKPLFLLTWDALYAARLFSGLTGIVSVALCYWLLRGLVSRQAALAGTAFFGFMPLVVFHDRLALFDSTALLCLIAAIFLCLRQEGHQPLTSLAAGFLFGVAVFTKGYALLALLLWLPILRRRSWDKARATALGLGFLACLLVASLFLAPQMLENLQDLRGALSVPDRFLASDLSIGQRISLAFAQLGQSFGYLHGYGGWALLPLVLLAAVLPGTRQRLRLELLAAWLLFSLILCVAFQFFFSRYLLVSLPSLALLIALAIDDCSEKISSVQRHSQIWIPTILFALAAVCCVNFVYRDVLVAAQLPDRVLPPRDAYQYVWGAPSGFGLREIAAELRHLDLMDDRKLICVTRGMGTGTHGAATLPLLLRHTPIRFVHLWLESDEDIRFIQNLPERSQVVVFVEEPGFLDDRMLSRLEARPKLLLEVKGTAGRPDYRLVELLRPLTNDNSYSRMEP